MLSSKAKYGLKAMVHLARREGVYMPIVDTVHAVLYEGMPLRRAVSELMNRAAGHELE